MPKVLVVDDTATDRRLVGGLLENDALLKVAYAENGVEALKALEEAAPDLVLTDMQMPEMNGLELVMAVRKNYPRVPVILMTAHGSEQLAVEALDRGAASYIPKANLANQLVDTVNRVLELVSEERTDARFIDCLRKFECAFELGNDYTLIPPAVHHLQACAELAGFDDPTDRLRLGVALEEAIINAHHGNLELNNVPDLPPKEYVALADQRRSSAPYCDRRIRVEASFDDREAVYIVTDEGAGFDTSRVPDPADPAALVSGASRGLVLMRNFMDVVTFNEEGNAVTMVKWRDAEVLQL